MTEQEEQEEAPKKCDECNVIGTECIECGWRMKILNLYVEDERVPSREFFGAACAHVPSGTSIQLIRNHGATTLCEVGFDLEPETKLRLSTYLAGSLETLENVKLTFIQRVFRLIKNLFRSKK